VWTGSPPAPPRRLLLHAALFLATLASLTLAGYVMDGPPQPDPAARGILGFLRYGLPYGLSVAAILGAHEMGHYLAARHYGIPATLPFFLPFLPPIGSLGALIRIRGVIPHRKALFDVAAAGPIAGFVVAIPILAAGLLVARPFPLEALTPGTEVYIFGHPPLYRLLRSWLVTVDGTVEMNGLMRAGWVGMLITSLNLFPVGQLDGGHAAYALGRRLHRRLTWATIGLLGALLVYQALTLGFPVYALWFAILLWMRDRHPRLLDEITPPGPGRAWVALLLALIFVLTAMAVPIRLGSI